MKFIKLDTDKWFSGSTRWELEPDERGVWVDLFVRAGAGGDPIGEIHYYSFQQLSDYFRITLELFERTIKKCSKPAKEDDDPKVVIDEKARIIYIVKWNEYQSTYLRNEETEYKVREMVNKLRVDFFGNP